MEYETDGMDGTTREKKARTEIRSDLLLLLDLPMDLIQWTMWFLTDKECEALWETTTSLYRKRDRFVPGEIAIRLRPKVTLDWVTRRLARYGRAQRITVIGYHPAHTGPSSKGLDHYTKIMDLIFRTGILPRHCWRSLRLVRLCVPWKGWDDFEPMSSLQSLVFKNGAQKSPFPDYSLPWPAIDRAFPSLLFLQIPQSLIYSRELRELPSYVDCEPIRRLSISTVDCIGVASAAHRRLPNLKDVSLYVHFETVEHVHRLATELYGLPPLTQLDIRSYGDVPLSELHTHLLSRMIETHGETLEFLSLSIGELSVENAAVSSPTPLLALRQLRTLFLTPPPLAQHSLTVHFRSLPPTLRELSLSHIWFTPDDILILLRDCPSLQEWFTVDSVFPSRAVDIMVEHGLPPLLDTLTLVRTQFEHTEDTFLSQLVRANSHHTSLRHLKLSGCYYSTVTHQVTDRTFHVHALLQTRCTVSFNI